MRQSRRSPDAAPAPVLLSPGVLVCYWATSSRTAETLAFVTSSVIFA
jgi:hypothetical protein